MIVIAGQSPQLVAAETGADRDQAAAMLDAELIGDPMCLTVHPPSVPDRTACLQDNLPDGLLDHRWTTCPIGGRPRPDG